MVAPHNEYMIKWCFTFRVNVYFVLSLWSLRDPLLFGVHVFERMIKGNQHLYTP
jgi:hypothetical protein